MNNIEIKHKGSIEKIDTTITLKKGTKYRLADLASKGESYDDVISRILHENKKLKAENQQYAQRLEQLNALDVNRIDVLKIERIKDAVNINNELIVVFSYAKPSIPPDDEYRMEMVIDSFLKNGKKVREELDISIEDTALIALTIITKIINNHFDPAFRLSRKINVIDRRYWKKVYGRVGLPMSSYISDIMPIITDYERGMD